MNNDDMQKHLNLLDKAKREERTTLRFAENFEVQSSAEGDYYIPNVDHTDLVYDALKFKKLKFPNATATPEIGSTTTIAPPPSGAIDDGVSPIMRDLVVYLQEGVMRYMPRLPCVTDFRFRDYIARDYANGITGDRWQIEDGVFIRGLNLYSYYIIISLDDPYSTLDTTRTYDLKAISNEGRESNVAKLRFVQPPAV